MMVVVYAQMVKHRLVTPVQMEHVMSESVNLGRVHVQVTTGVPVSERLNPEVRFVTTIEMTTAMDNLMKTVQQSCTSLVKAQQSVTVDRSV